MDNRHKSVEMHRVELLVPIKTLGILSEKSARELKTGLFILIQKAS